MVRSLPTTLVLLLAGCHVVLPLQQGGANDSVHPDGDRLDLTGDAPLLDSTSQPDAPQPQDAPQIDGPAVDTQPQPDGQSHDTTFVHDTPQPDLPIASDVASTPFLLITEVMVDPKGTEPVYEWFEIYNPTGLSYTLSNWKIADKQWVHTITGNLSIGSKQYLVLAHSQGGVPADYYYGSGGGASYDIWLDNINDKVELRLPNGFVVDKVEWSAGWPIYQGYSMSLKDPTFNNDLPGSWCQDNTGLADTKNYGSPGSQGICN